ncbi:MAG: hypothetical protein M1830_003172, partial [Pleopsidium flavum]
MAHHIQKSEYVGGIEHYDHDDSKKTGSETYSQDAYVEEFTPAEQRRIIHRIDRRLVVTCGFMYCISLMDRTNLSAAIIAGMAKELKLTVGTRYSIV